jgi:hypothetical protein
MPLSQKNWGGGASKRFFLKISTSFDKFLKKFPKVTDQRNKISEDWRIISHSHSTKSCFNHLLKTRSHVEDDTGIVVGVLIFASYRFHTCLQNLKHHNKWYRKVQ